MLLTIISTGAPAPGAPVVPTPQIYVTASRDSGLHGKISTLTLRCLAISKHLTQDQKWKKDDWTDLQSASWEDSVHERQVS